MKHINDWRTESHTVNSGDFKLRTFELASQPDANVATNARENDVANNLIFKWQNGGRVSRSLPATITASKELSQLPVDIVSEPATSDMGYGQYPLVCRDRPCSSATGTAGILRAIPSALDRHIRRETAESPSRYAQKT